MYELNCENREVKVSIIYEPQFRKLKLSKVQNLTHVMFYICNEKLLRMKINEIIQNEIKTHHAETDNTYKKENADKVWQEKIMIRNTLYLSMFFF